jgi:hypothetical protein
MLTVRLLTQGANGNVVADAVFDPPAGAAIRHDAVLPAGLPVEARGPAAVLHFALAAPADWVPNDTGTLRREAMVPNDTGTRRREAAVDAVFRSLLNGEIEVAVPLALGGSLPAPSASAAASILTAPATVASDPFQVSHHDTRHALDDDLGLWVPATLEETV